MVRIAECLGDKEDSWSSKYFKKLAVLTSTASLIDARLTGPTMQLSFNCDPESLPERKDTLLDLHWLLQYCERDPCWSNPILWRSKTLAFVFALSTTVRTLGVLGVLPPQGATSERDRYLPFNLKIKIVGLQNVYWVISLSWGFHATRSSVRSSASTLQSPVARQADIYWLARQRSKTERDLFWIIIDSCDRAKVTLPRFPQKRTPKSTPYETVREKLCCKATAVSLPWFAALCPNKERTWR